MAFDESECIRQMTQIIAAGDPSPASPSHDRAAHIYTQIVAPLVAQIPVLGREVEYLRERNSILAAHCTEVERLNVWLTSDRDRLIAENRALRERPDGYAE
jgi:hypothetical protein